MKKNLFSKSVSNTASRRDFFKTTGKALAASAITVAGIPYVEIAENKEMLS